MRYSTAALSAALLFCVACTRVPDQSDVTRVDTLDIIRNIRCETKDALFAYPRSRSIDRSLISYSFEFASSEINTLSGGSTLLIPLTAGTFTLGLDAGVVRRRDGEQVINFQEDLGNLRTLDCSRANFVDSSRYPIIGHVGTREVVDKFVELNSQRGLLQGKFIRTLFFRVTLSGGVRPSLSIIPAKGHKRDGSLSLGGSRDDSHRLVISLKPPPTTTTPTGERMSVEEAADELLKAKKRALQELDVERSLRIERQLLEKIDP